MAYSALVGSVGSFSVATQSEVETFTGSGILTSSNIQHALGALTSLIKITYTLDTSGFGGGILHQKTSITNISGFNLSDWDILDPLTDNAAWLARGACQVYLGDRTKNLLVMNSAAGPPIPVGEDAQLTDTSAAASGGQPADSWIMLDPNMSTGGAVSPVIVTIAAIRRSV